MPFRATNVRRYRHDECEIVLIVPGTTISAPMFTAGVSLLVTRCSDRSFIGCHAAVDCAR